MNVIERDKMAKIYEINRQLSLLNVDIMMEIQAADPTNKYLAKLTGCAKLLSEQQKHIASVTKADNKKKPFDGKEFIKSIQAMSVY